jgi:uncharacterized protein YcaQ
VKLDRAEGVLRVPGVWWETGVRATSARVAALHAQLVKLARFVGAEQVAGL